MKIDNLPPSLDSVAEASSIENFGDQQVQTLASLRHEFRTPMNHIIGYCELLLEEASEDKQNDIIHELEKIHKTGQHLLALINELVAAHKPDILLNGLSKVRHEMHSLANGIIDSCVLLQKSAEASPASNFISDLDKIQTGAKRLLDQINEYSLPSQRQQNAEKPRSAGAVPEYKLAVATPTNKSGYLLLVDDNQTNRDMLLRRLEQLGHQVVTAVNGREALEIMAFTQFDLILLDVMMPEMDGHETLSRIKSDDTLKHIPVIMISALDELNSIVRCIEMGAVDYIPKPFNPVLLNARINASLEKKRLRDQEVVYRRQIEEYNLHLEERVREQVSVITQVQMGTIFALSKLAESRDPETGAHLERVREYSKLLAVILGKNSRYLQLVDSNFIEDLYIASPLHDIGKVCLPDHILLKPGRHTDEEFAIMKTHSALGAKTLREVNQQNENNNFIKMGIEIAESHHEKWDGTGYPLGLAGIAIPLSGRILALADVYDALRSKRCYKEAFSHEKTCDIIFQESGKQFDPDVVACFQEAEPEFGRIWHSLNDQI